MTYEIYQYIFYGSLIMCIIMLVLSIILFFVFKIPKIVGFLTGATARKAIKSINEHTEKLLRNLKILRNVYENIVDKNPNVDERLWNLLEIACVYHDIGKVYSPSGKITLSSSSKIIFVNNTSKLDAALFKVPFL